jgi:hypothetical protein
VYGSKKTNASQFYHIPERDPFQFFGEGKQDPHGNRSDKQPVPDQQAFIQVNQLAQYAGEPGKKNRNVKLEKSFFH